MSHIDVAAVYFIAIYSIDNNISQNFILVEEVKGEFSAMKNGTFYTQNISAIDRGYLENRTSLIVYPNPSSDFIHLSFVLFINIKDI